MALSKENSEGVRKTLLVLLVFFGAWGLSEVYNSLDHRGWITHHMDTPVSSADWWVGEYRTCDLITNLNIGKGPKAKYLDCPKGSGASPASADLGHDSHSLPGRVLPVTYHGRIDRADTFIEWRCQRKEASLECSAID